MAESFVNVNAPEDRRSLEAALQERAGSLQE
jgi:hypothetical protein